MSAIHLDKAAFETQIEKSDKTALVDFWAPWCGPCKMLGPVIDQISNELEGDVLVGKVNVDENQELTIKFGVMSIPTVLAFKNGKEVGRLVGVVPKDKLVAMVKNI